MKQSKVIVIVGPTASGKSRVANALAKKLNTYVISADSMQIYKELDIGTAKENEETSGVKQALTNICNYTDEFNVCLYKKMAYDEIDKMLTKGLVPIICGGTGLYINAVVNNIDFDSYDITSNQKKEIDDEYDALYKHLTIEEKKRLTQCTEDNLRRLENKLKNKILLNKLGKEEKIQCNLWEENEKKYSFLIIYLETPRDLLYDRINKRVDGMVSAGILKEAEMLYKNKDKASRTVMQAIGYKELFNYLDNVSTLEECIEVLKQHTRNYAKRQITWFNKLKNTVKINATQGVEKNVQEIIERYDEK